MTFKIVFPRRQSSISSVWPQRGHAAARPFSQPLRALSTMTRLITRVA